MRILLAITAAALLAGCSTPAAVVTTEIEIDKANGTLRVSSPKNIKVVGLKTSVTPDGARTIEVAEYASTADPGALDAVREQYRAAAALNAAAAEIAGRAAGIK